MAHISNICWSNLRTFYGISVEFLANIKSDWSHAIQSQSDTTQTSFFLFLSLFQLANGMRIETLNCLFEIKYQQIASTGISLFGEKTLPNRSTLKRFGGKSEKIDNDDEVILLEYHKSFFFLYTFCWLNICVECKRMAFV